MSKIKISPNDQVTKFLSGIDDCEGKTIKSVLDECPGYTEYKVIRFTDGTAIALREMEDGGHDLSGTTFESAYSLRDRVYFGMEPAATLEAQETREAAQRAAEAEQRERIQYETLKAKFEK